MEEIGVLLPKVLKPQLSRLEPPVVEVLAPLWTRVAGKALARQCRPVAFSAGTLTLATDDADWAEPLQQMAEEIRAHVNNFLGKPVVKHIRILRVGRSIAATGHSGGQKIYLSPNPSGRIGRDRFPARLLTWRR